MTQSHALTAGMVLLTTIAACSEEPNVIENRYTQTVTLKLGVCLETRMRQAWQHVLDSQVQYPGSIEATYANNTLDCVLDADTCFEVYQCLGHNTTTACSSGEPFCEGATVNSCTVLNTNGYGWTKREACDQGLTAAMGNTQCLVDEYGDAGCYAETCADYDTWCAGDVIHRCSGGNSGYDDGPTPALEEPSNPSWSVADTMTATEDAHGSHDDDAGPVDDPVVDPGPVEDPYLLHTTDCTMRGQQCVGSGSCRTVVGKSCVKDSCDGTVLETCGPEDVVEARMNCANLGPTYRCVENDEGAVACRSVDELQCEGGETLCVGSSLYFCVGGAWQVVHCGAFMSAECDADYGECFSVIWQNTKALITPDNPGGLDLSATPAATSGNTQAACEAYTAVSNACLREFFEGMGLDYTDTDFAETVCGSYSTNVQAATDYFNCLTDTYSSADCSDTLPDDNCTM